jgi:hypothetical protein
MTNEELNQAYAEQLANRRAANCYDIHEAAQAIALQLGLNEYRTEKLRDDMGQAAFDGALTVRSPGGHDQYAPTSPPKTTYGFDSLTTPDDVNQWATERRFTWRWLSEPKDEASSPASNSECFPWPRVMHGQRVWRLSEAIDEIARALEWHSSQRDRLMAQAVKDATAGVLVLRDLYAGGIMKRGDHMSELLDYVFSRDMNAWLDLIDASFPYRLPDAEPAQEPQAASVVAVGASGDVEQTPDAERRLARLRALGGTAKYVRHEWKFTGMADLVESEKADDRKRRSEKTIRADLIQAAQAERDEKSAGFGAGLGQR